MIRKMIFNKISNSNSKINKKFISKMILTRLIARVCFKITMKVKIFKFSSYLDKKLILNIRGSRNWVNKFNSNNNKKTRKIYIKI